MGFAVEATHAPPASMCERRHRLPDDACPASQVEPPPPSTPAVPSELPASNAEPMMTPEGTRDRRIARVEGRACLDGGKIKIRRGAIRGRIYRRHACAEPTAHRHACPPNRRHEWTCLANGPFAGTCCSRLGRVAVTPDRWLYHLSVYPASNGMNGDRVDAASSTIARARR